MSLRRPSFEAYAWAPAEPAHARLVEALARWGVKALDGEPGPGALAGLLERHPGVTHAVLAMQPGRAAAILPPLREAGIDIEIWRPRESAPEMLPETPVRALEDVLRLRTAHEVGLFVDWPLLRSGACRSVSEAAEGLLRRAELLGAVTTARVYGCGDAGAVDLAGTASVFPTEAAADGPAADGLLRRDLCALLEDPSAPRTWILGASAAWLPDLLRQAHQRGIRVLLWAVDEGLLPASVRAEADGCADLRMLLPHIFRSAAPVSAAYARVAMREEPLREREPPRARETAGAALTAWVRLAYHVECALRRRRRSRIPLDELAVELAMHEDYGPNPSTALLWLNRAGADGLLLLEGDEASSQPLVRPSAEHPAARAAVEVPDRALRLLHQMLHKIPWVSFKLLRGVLVREQWLGGPRFRLNEAAVDDWLNFLIRDGAVRMTKEPNLMNPNYPVTALRLNPDHPLAADIAAEAGETIRLAAERAILAVDHFLTRNRKPWMAMSALRRTLDGLSREELQAVLQTLQNVGALVTESYPNPQREHATTGCRLQREIPLVTSVLTTRNAFIRVTQYQQRSRSWVPLWKLDEELGELGVTLASPAQRLAWVQLLRDEGILELDYEGALPEDAWQSVRCRLNLGDPVVRSVVAREQRIDEDSRRSAESPRATADAAAAG
jgi:hypothetical protein